MWKKALIYNYIVEISFEGFMSVSMKSLMNFIVIITLKVPVSELAMHS